LNKLDNAQVASRNDNCLTLSGIAVTIVMAGDVASAQTLCTTLTGTSFAPAALTKDGYTTAPTDAWRCG
jgi:hypothetical protein